ncbi:MAG: bifunctional metallophosphatase/5'-nucleotidase [Deltaproteobacteria bacterium]|nr:bifunctional metallophosphatase/5'-nucleotidase [Deltaproteobacteria bacterium]
MKRSLCVGKRARAIFFLAALLSISLLPGLCPATSLTILHTNDTHSHLLPFSYPAAIDPCSPATALPGRSNIGGIARRATLVKQIRSELKTKGIPVWLVDAGDFSDGTLFSMEYRGDADVAAMNAAGYDCATLGNHEFIYTLAQTRKLISLARYPILCANALLKATKEPLAQLYQVEQAGPIRVGIFGLVTIEARSYPAAKEGVVIADPVRTARKIVTKLRAEKADIIVLISHCGEEMDKRLASMVPGIDVIVGGHSHSRLPSGEFIPRTEEVVADKVKGTIIVQAYQWGGELGRCDLFFKKDPAGAWHVDRYRARLIPITAALEPEVQVAAVVDRYWKPIAPRYAEVIGEAADDFSSRCDDWAEYNLVADAVRETFGTEIEIENLGGVRSPLLKGKITRGDLVALDPFANTVVTFEITGRQLRKILARYAPAVSGVRYRLESGELVEALVNGEPLQDGRRYTGATNSYFAGRAFKGARVRFQDTGKQRLEVLVNFIRQKGTILPVYDKRRVVIGDFPLKAR